MDSESENKETQLIDVEKVLHTKNPALARALPGFIINYLKRIVHQDELNEFLKKWGHLRDSELILPGLNILKLNSGFTEVRISPKPEGISLFQIIRLADLTDWYLFMNYQNISMILNSR